MTLHCEIKSTILAQLVFSLAQRVATTAFKSQSGTLSCLSCIRVALRISGKEIVYEYSNAPHNGIFVKTFVVSGVHFEVV